MTNKKNINVKYKIIASVILLSLIVGALMVDKNIILINKSRAQIIIGAVYSYKKDMGEFPKILDELKPNYLEKIPTTVYGDTFFYFSNSVDGFGISFTVRARYGCGYIDHYQVWECSFGD